MKIHKRKRIFIHRRTYSVTYTEGWDTFGMKTSDKWEERNALAALDKLEAE
jgi:hypothetical protein